MKAKEAFLRSFTCAGVFCGFAVPYIRMDEPQPAWPIVRALLAALFAALIIGTTGAKFGWPRRWWQFAVGILVIWEVAVCALELVGRITGIIHAT